MYYDSYDPNDHERYVFMRCRKFHNNNAVLKNPGPEHQALNKFPGHDFNHAI